MDISSRVDFSGDVETVFAMMTDQAYLEEVCRATHARSYEAAVDGLVTRTSRQLPAPEAAARFTGPELTVVEELTWPAAAAADGTRTAQIVLTIPRQPVAMHGTVRLSPGGRGTVAQLTGELKVSVPLFGKKLEQASAPAVLAGFKIQQEVGESWLARA